MLEQPANRQAEFNLCGVLVQARPSRVTTLHRELNALPGVEVHQCAPSGHLVITVEDTVQCRAADTLSAIHVIDGVLSAALVYHHCERDVDAAANAKEN
jgi:nitrate reductase NapD